MLALLVVVLAGKGWYVKDELLVLPASELEPLKERLLPECLLASNALPVKPQDCTISQCVCVVFSKDAQLKRLVLFDADVVLYSLLTFAV